MNLTYEEKIHLLIKMGWKTVFNQWWLPNWAEEQNTVTLQTALKLAGIEK